MKKWIEELLRKVLGEVLGAESLAGLLKAVVEKVLAENPDWVKAIAARVKAIAEEEKGKEAAEDAEGAKAEAEEPEETRQDAASPDAEPKLSWCYGGFNGGKARVVEDAVLESATLKGDMLSFKWAKGGCEQLGATSKSDSGHTVACLFLQDGAGGKFEWVSTSRKTRSMKNIKEGYNGWPKTALDGGGKLWFCIAGVKDDKVSCNGKRTACVEVRR